MNLIMPSISKKNVLDFLEISPFWFSVLGPDDPSDVIKHSQSFINH